MSVGVRVIVRLYWEFDSVKRGLGLVGNGDLVRKLQNNGQIFACSIRGRIRWKQLKFVKLSSKSSSRGQRIVGMENMRFSMKSFGFGMAINPKFHFLTNLSSSWALPNSKSLFEREMNGNYKPCAHWMKQVFAAAVVVLFLNGHSAKTW